MSKPNFIIITSDQQHYNTIGAFNSEIKTPFLDRLCAEGTVFQRAYCSNPTCTPSRASIITGKYPSRHGAWALGTKLPENENTLGDELLKNGYKTALVGKAHFQPLASTDSYTSIESRQVLGDLEFWKRFREKFYGFEHVRLLRNHAAEPHVGQHYALWLEEKGCNGWEKYFFRPKGTMHKKIRCKWSIPEELHYNRFICEEACSLLDKYKQEKQNFFMWISFPDPHPPYMVPKPWDTMYDTDQLTIPTAYEGEHEKNPPHYGLTQKEAPDFSGYKEEGIHMSGLQSHVRDKDELKKDIAVYYGMISFMDKYIGTILDRLDALDLANDTLVLFTTDHGHLFGQHGLINKGPFHYEDIIRVPFVVRYPGKVPKGKTSLSMQSLVDIMPTFLDMAGILIPRDVEGVSQSKVWGGTEQHVRDHIICENRQSPTTVHLKTYVDAKYKITVYYGCEYGELYDLEKDPGEFENLWDNPAFTEIKMRLLLKYISAELGKERMWMPRISGA